ncbi:MAG: hypothetical protein JNL96_13735 [Planctomycetaceae bacterium]|nr:hypothetical protein [Planctomycetaceae bacterium]
MPGFDPSRFSGRVDCGFANCGSDQGRPAQISLAVDCHATEGISIALHAACGRKEVFAIMGAEGWPQFLRAVKEAEKVVKQLIDGKKADELRIIVPGAG